jgi:hypothetical protein
MRLSPMALRASHDKAKGIRLGTSYSEMSQYVPNWEENARRVAATRPGILCAPSSLHAEHGEKNTDC